MMERAWEYIAIAYQGRAHIALGYASWDEYVDAAATPLGRFTDSLGFATYHHPGPGE